MGRIRITTEKPKLAEAIQQFLDERELKGLRSATLKDYERKMRRFQEFMENNGYEEVSKTAYLEYIRSLQDSGLNGNTINSFLMVLRVYVRWGMDNGYWDGFKVELLKVDEVVRPTYTNEQLKKLLRKPNPIKTFVELRTWTLTNFLVGTGARLGMTLELRIQDVDFNDKMIIFPQTKQRKVHRVPLSKKLASVLKEYLKVRKGEPTDYLFCTSYGNQLRERIAQDDIAKYNRKRGISLTSAHAYRRTFAKLYILNGGDAFRLQQLLGHADITTTKKYVAMFSEDLAVDYDKLNPLDNLTTKGSKITL